MRYLLFVHDKYSRHFEPLRSFENKEEAWRFLLNDKFNDIGRIWDNQQNRFIIYIDSIWDYIDFPDNNILHKDNRIIVFELKEINENN